MTRPVRVLELRSVRGTGGGPEKTILMGARRTNPRVAVTVCYLRDAADPDFTIGRRAADLDVEYVEVAERHALDRRAWTDLRQIVQEREIDIVHAHDYKTDALALLLARSDGIIPLATAHGWTGHSPRERLFYYPLDKRLLARFPRIIAVSTEIRTELIRCGVRPDRVRVVLNGIDPEAFRRQPGLERSARAALGFVEGDVVIGSVGRLEPQKRFDVLIDACSRLQDRWPALRLVIAGAGSCRADIEARARERVPNGACRLLAHRSDIADLHHAFDLYVQSSDYEGTPNAVLEAMALETPLVATDAGGTADIVRDGIDGLIVRCGDVGALAGAIDRALSNAPETRDRARAARLRIENELSFDQRMASVEAIYLELAAALVTEGAAGDRCA